MLMSKNIGERTPEDWERHEGDVWWQYFFAVGRRTRRIVKGRFTYMPSPSDIYRRRMELRWLEGCGFDRHFIASVMEHDMPCLERVMKMVERYGVEETRRRCSPFLADTEYGGW